MDDLTGGVPDVSVCIVNWNTRELLRRCLQSIRDHTTGLAVEVIVVDNASRDSSAEMVAQHFPETRLVVSNQNLGFAGNREFFMNTLNWLSLQENLIAIRPRQPEDRRLSLTPDQQNRIAILTIFLIPGIVFASGIYAWWRRR